MKKSEGKARTRADALYRGLRRDKRHPWRNENLGRLLLVAVDNWQNALVRGLQEAGFKDFRSTHMNLLRHIDMGGTRITEIADRAGVTKQAIGKLIVACEKRGLVRTIADPTDGRAKVVLFTRQSREVILAERSVIRRIDEQLRHRLGASALASLRTSLIVMADSTDFQLGMSQASSTSNGQTRKTKSSAR
jgi:DNA-binding MarR family transcriptional regulator